MLFPGIEPGATRWQRAMLPLHQKSFKRLLPSGIEPEPTLYESVILPLNYRSKPPPGIEPGSILYKSIILPFNYGGNLRRHQDSNLEEPSSPH